MKQVHLRVTLDKAAVELNMTGEIGEDRIVATVKALLTALEAMERPRVTINPIVNSVDQRERREDTDCIPCRESSPGLEPPPGWPYGRAAKS